MNPHLRFAAIFTLAIAIVSFTFTSREGTNIPFLVLAAIALVSVWTLYAVKTRREATA